MRSLIWAAIIALNILVISDILNKLRGNVERFLWIVAVLALPVLGAGFWIYIQYIVPKQRRLAREKRRAKKVDSERR